MVTQWMKFTWNNLKVKVKGQEHKVCKLMKSLYGHKQAPKQWHEKYDKVILDYGFKANDHDKCVYYKMDLKECIILCLYVDDILIFGSNVEIVNDIEEYLSTNFEMKDLQETHINIRNEIFKNK